MTGRSWAAYVFDLDGTLVDSREGIEWAARKAVERAAPGQQLVGFGDAIGARVPLLFRGCLPTATAEQVAAVGAEFRRLYDKDGWRMSRPFEGVRELLEALSITASCHVVTNKPARATHDILGEHSLRRLLDRVVSPDSAPGHPDKRAALASLVADLGHPPPDVVYVGDTLEDHAAAAHAATAFVGAGYGYGRAGLHSADLLVVDTPQELAAHLLP